MSGITTTLLQRPRDPQFNNTTLLLSGNFSTNGAQNNTFLDSSSNNFTITRNPTTGPNAPTQGTFSPFSQTGWGVITSERSYLSIPASSDFDLISTDFTIEFWFNLNAFNTMASSGNNFFGNGLATATDGWSMEFGGSGSAATSIGFRVFNGGSQTVNTFSGLTLNIGTWYHIVLQRNGTGAGNLRLFVNGVLQGSAQNSFTYTNAGSTFTFGSGAYTQNAGFSGNASYFISNVRLTKAAVYSTSGFTSPTSSLSPISGTTLLICQSNRLINNGTNTGAITSTGHLATRVQVLPFSPFAPSGAYDRTAVGGSAFFDGAGDYLTIPSNAAFSYGTSDYSQEFWIYLTTSPATFQRPLQYSDDRDNIVVETGNFNFFDGTAATISAATTGQWFHLCVTRVGGTLRGFVNGRLGFTRSGSYNSGTRSLALGATSAGANPLGGYTTNYRIVKGGIPTAYSTSSTTVGAQIFSPPTAPFTGSESLTAGSVSLLLNFTNAGIFDSTAKNVVETVRDAQISTTQSRFGGTSIFFDGTQDCLRFQNGPNQNFALGSGDWTIEMWVYLTAAVNHTLLDIYDGGAPGRILTQINPSGAVQFLNASGGNRTTTTSTVSQNTWTHIAFCKASGSTRIFINGVQGNTTYADTNTYTCTTGPVLFGVNAFDFATSPFTGYASNIRITKFARYTANFSVPTIGFTNR